MIVVTGATGHVGRHVVDELVAAGAPVRAAVRDPLAARLPAAVDVRRADLTAPETVAAALDGAVALFLLWAAPAQASAPAVVEAVARAGVPVVHLSSLGVRDDRERQADPINEGHAQLERLLAAADVPRTTLRPSGFATNTLGWAPKLRAGDVLRAPSGAARRSLLHEADLGAVAARMLLRPSSQHAGARLELSGPAAIRQDEQLAAIAAATGRDLRWDEQPRDEAVAELTEAVGDPAVAAGMVDTWATWEQEPEPVTGTVAAVLGRPARTYAAWAQEHAGEFRREAVGRLR